MSPPIRSISCSNTKTYVVKVFNRTEKENRIAGIENLGEWFVLSKKQYIIVLGHVGCSTFACDCLTISWRRLTFAVARSAILKRRSTSVVAGFTISCRRSLYAVACLTILFLYLYFGVAIFIFVSLVCIVV